MPKSVSYPEAWKLSPLEMAYLNALRPGKVVSIPELTALHKAPVQPQRVRKVIAALRDKLDPLDVEISTHWEAGWKLERAARQRLTTLLRGEK